MDGRKDQDGQRARFLIRVGDRDVQPIAYADPDPHRSTVHAERGLSTPRVFELSSDDAPAFRAAIASLREGNRYAASVYVYDEAEYRDMRLFTTQDGKAGFALHDDDIVSVFARSDGDNHRPGFSLLATAVSLGGRRLDCFDTVLPSIYGREGFVPVARLPWNDDYAPADWDKATYAKFNHGEPDVVFMAYDPDYLDHTYQPGAGALVTDYDEAGQRIHTFLTERHPPYGWEDDGL